jgi:hypothetical protein
MRRWWPSGRGLGECSTGALVGVHRRTGTCAPPQQSVAQAHTRPTLLCSSLGLSLSTLSLEGEAADTRPTKAALHTGVHRKKPSWVIFSQPSVYPDLGASGRGLFGVFALAWYCPRVLRSQSCCRMGTFGLTQCPEIVPIWDSSTRRGLNNHDKTASGTVGADHRYWDSGRSPEPAAPQ